MAGYGFYSLDLPTRKILRFVNPAHEKKGDAITLKSTVVDTGNGLARTTLIRAGLLVVKKTSDGKYYRADDGSVGADRNAGAVVTAAEAADADWASKTVSLYINGRLIVTVTLGGSDDSNSEVATALNANTTFAAYAVADGSGALLTVTSLQKGADVVLKVISNLATAFGTYGTDAVGTDADYRVVGGDDGSPIDMFDASGAVMDTAAPNYVAGSFVLAALIGPTGEGLAVLARRGSLFAA